MISATAYDRHVELLLDVMQRLHSALTKARIEHRLVGGMAVFLHVSERLDSPGTLTSLLIAKILKGSPKSPKSLGFVTGTPPAWTC